VQIYCDESGGVGRGVMTLAAVAIDQASADSLLQSFRAATRLTTELKGSRIDLDERSCFFDLLEKTKATATVGIAISAATPGLGEDRGKHDQKVYAALLDDVIGSMLPQSGGCAAVTIDDGRYDAATLAYVRSAIAARIGPCGHAKLELSHRSAGLQIADVIANSFFNRALPGVRQGRMAHIVQPFLDDGRISLRILPND
jgi:Protein of unknown function (DUF3800)